MCPRVHQVSLPSVDPNSEWLSELSKVHLTLAAEPQATAPRDHYGAAMTRPARLGRPTGPRPGFSRDDVVDAALEIGIAEFTLTAVAKHLGVAVSGLYRTISSREDLLAACLERIAAEVDVPAAGLPMRTRFGRGCGCGCGCGC